MLFKVDLGGTHTYTVFVLPEAGTATVLHTANVTTNTDAVVTDVP